MYVPFLSLERPLFHRQVRQLTEREKSSWPTLQLKNLLASLSTIPRAFHALERGVTHSRQTWGPGAVLCPPPPPPSCSSSSIEKEAAADRTQGVVRERCYSLLGSWERCGLEIGGRDERACFPPLPFRPRKDFRCRPAGGERETYDRPQFRITVRPARSVAVMRRRR